MTPRRARPVRAPAIEAERARRRIAERMFGRREEAVRIAGYEVLSRLGGGGQGDVYQVRDPRLGRRLALKIVRDPIPGRAIDEARALARLSHVNVVTIFDAGIVDHADGEATGFIAMEWIDGRSLDRWCDPAVPWHERLRLLVEAGRGLAAAHAAGLVHGDVKPSNVMVGPDRRARVIDFGLSRVADAGTGTPGFRAPECLVGPPDAMSDQFGWCRTALAILFDGHSVAPSHWVATRCRAVLDRGCRTRPEDRWASLDELLRRLEATPSRAWVGLGALVGAALVASWPGPERTTTPCADASHRYDQMWSPQRKAELEAAFVRGAPGFGARSWAVVRERVDALVAAWTVQRIDACRALADDPPLAPARRIDRCLDYRQAELDGWLEGLGDVDANGVRRAVAQVDDLTARIACRDEVAFAASTVTLTGRRDAVEARLARAAGLSRAGRHDEADDVFASLHRETASWIDDAITARIALERGTHEWRRTDVHRARATLENAFHAAGAAGADYVQAQAAITLLDLSGRRLARFQDARTWERHARAAVERLDEPSLRFRLDWTWAAALNMAGDSEAARAILSSLLQTLRDAPGSTPLRVADLYLALSRVESTAERSVEALRWAELAAAAQAERVGEDHPDYADALFRLGIAQEQRSRLDDARRSLERALAIHERNGNLDYASGIHNSLAIVLERQRDFEGAERSYNRVLELLGDSAPANVLATRSNLGMLGLARDRPEDALVQFRLARELADEVYRGDHPVLCAIDHGFGVAYTRTNDPRAIEHLERATERALRLGLPSALHGQYRYALGQARWTVAGDRPRALAEVQQAIEELETDPEAFADALAEARAWLRTRAR